MMAERLREGRPLVSAADRPSLSTHGADPPPYLGDGGGADGLVQVEALEKRFDRAAKFRLDDRPHGRPGHGGDGVKQDGQGLADRRGDKVDAGSE